MGEKPVCVVDANVLLNLATPVVDGRERAPTGADPLKAVLSSYDVRTTTGVLGEVSAATGDDDLLSAAATLVLQASHRLSAHDVESRTEDPLDYGLDRGESECIWLANDLSADLFVTDEFSSTNYLFVNLVLEDRNTLFTTPHLLCVLAIREILPSGYVDAALAYYTDTKGWDDQYVAQLRQRYLSD
jgi:hypothetical protein